MSADEDWQNRAAVVGHELRAPLTSIEGWVEILLDGALGDLTPEQARAVEVIGRNAQRLRAIVADLRSAQPSSTPAGGRAAGRAGRRSLPVAVDLVRPTARLGGVVLDERPRRPAPARAR